MKNKNSFIYIKFLRNSFKLTRTITQQKIKALISAHQDRDRKKRDFRGLWISQINTVIHIIYVVFTCQKN